MIIQLNNNPLSIKSSAYQDCTATAGTTVHVEAETTTSAKTTAVTQDVNGGLKLLIKKGNSFVYQVNGAGSYTPQVRLDSDPATAGQACVHFEQPQGTTIGSQMCISPGQQWTTVVSHSSGQLQSGSLRIVVDSSATNGSSWLNWFELIPAIGGTSKPANCTLTGQTVSCPQQ